MARRSIRENTVDGAAVISPIRPIWPQWRGRYQQVRCHGGRVLFFLQNGVELAQKFDIVTVLPFPR